MVINTTKKGLGRGLSSLMGDTDTSQTKNTNVGQETKIPIANLKPSHSQTRRLLNKNIINEKSLQLMKKSTFLTNTARGELIEENSLCKALNNDQIAGAGLDVYNNEPDINPKLLKAKNVVLLPHLGSATSKARNAMGFKVIDNLKSYFNSGKGIDIVKFH